MISNNRFIKPYIDLLRCLTSFILFPFKGLFFSQHAESRDHKTKSSYELYDGVETLLIFVGYPRSGHTLVSSLLDAHPHVIVANEFDILGQWQTLDDARRNKYFLFDQLVTNSKNESKVGYRSATVNHRYSYHVPGQWQGTYKSSIQVGELDC